MFEDFPVGPQWRPTAAESAAIAADFGLRLTGTPPPPRAGAINGIARIATAEGDWIVRVHRPWTSPARLAGVHRALAVLRAARHPIPAIRATPAGRTWTTLQDRLVEVNAFIPSDATADSDERGGAALALLARLHATLSTLPPEAVEPPLYSTHATPAAILAGLAETDSVFATLRHHATYPRAAAIREAARDLLVTLAAARAGYAASLSRTYIHGDYGGDNILFRDGRIVAILDFDFLAHRERVVDLARTLYWGLGPFGDARPAAPAPDEIARFAALLRRYQRASPTPLTGDELRALPYELARVPLFFVAEASYLPADAPEPAPLRQTLALGPQLGRAAWLTTHATTFGGRLVKLLD
jgi:Ser/Thr protein kinase RdoA (MazF antagonist)